jgi:predicted transcriptional regulator
MRTFIQPQKKQNEEKIEVRVDAEIVRTLREYAEFLDSPQGYIVTEILRKAFRKDKAFHTWRTERRAAEKAASSPKNTGKATGNISPLPAAS